MESPFNRLLRFAMISIWIRTKISILNSILYQKSSILSKIGWICSIFKQIRPISIKLDQFRLKYCHFWSINQHLVNLSRSFNQKLIENRLKMINFWSKSRSSTRLNRWKSNRTEIEDRYRSPWNPNHWRFDSKPWIALAYRT